METYRFLNPISPNPHFFPGEGQNLPFLDRIFEGEVMRFGENEKEINEGKFDEFYVKKEKNRKFQV